MDVDIKEIEEIQERRRAINIQPLEYLKVYENGELIDIPMRIINDFKFTGLSNWDFLTMRYWKQD